MGTPFTFTASSTAGSVTGPPVPAGPSPGGNCIILQSLPVGTIVTVAETIPVGDAVSSITVAPLSQLVPGTLSLAAGTVAITIGSGVTEVTYTDVKNTGYLEICKKEGDVQGSFTVNPGTGNLGPFAVPAGSCSPAIEVPAGNVVIQENLSPGTVMVGCTTIPVSAQGPCNFNTVPPTSMVTVVPGDVSAETVAIITNKRHQ